MFDLFKDIQFSLLKKFNPLIANCQPHKMFKHTPTIRRKFANELFECVSLFCGVGA